MIKPTPAIDLYLMLRSVEFRTNKKPIAKNRIRANTLMVLAMITDAIADSNVDVFKTIVIYGQTDVVADSGTDTLTLVASGGTTLTTTADQITIDTPAAGVTAGFSIAMAIAL